MAALLSIVIPAYGVGEYLPACLDSILAQTHKELEIIVIDDGSPDESGEIADDFASRDNRLSVLHSKNQGLGPARNTGAEIATGKYLMFVDSDDLLPPRAAELMVKSLEFTGSDFAAGNAWRYIEGRGNVQSWTHADIFNKTTLATHISRMPELIRDRMAWNKVFRRTFWDSNNFRFPPIRYEDYPVTLAAHLRADSVDILQDKVYLWRQRLAEDSITQRSLELDNLMDRVKSANLVLDLVEDRDDRVKELLHQYLTDIDIIVLATAYAENHDAHDAVGELASQLASRLSDTPDSKVLAKNILKRLRVKDLDTAGALAKWRVDRDKKALIKTIMQPRNIPAVASMGVDLLRDSGEKTKLKNRKLRSRVLSISRIESKFLISAQVFLRGMLLEKASFSAYLRNSTENISLATSSPEIYGQRATIEIELEDETIENMDDSPHMVILNVNVGPLSWTGELSISRSDFPSPESLNDEDIAVLSHWKTNSPSLYVRRIKRDQIANAEFKDDKLVITAAPIHEFIAILRPDPSRPLTAPCKSGTAVFDLADVIEDPADDPVSSLCYRNIVAMSKTAIDNYEQSLFSETNRVEEATETLYEQENPATTDKKRRTAVSAQEDRVDLLDRLSRKGITPLVSILEESKTLVFRDTVLSLGKSKTATLELSMQQLEHFPYPQRNKTT